MRYLELSHHSASAEPCATSAALRVLLWQLVTHCCRLSPWSLVFLQAPHLTETAEGDEPRPTSRERC